MKIFMAGSCFENKEEMKRKILLFDSEIGDI